MWYRNNPSSNRAVPATKESVQAEPYLAAIPPTPAERWAMICDAYLVQVYARSESAATRNEYGRLLAQLMALRPDLSLLTVGDARLWAYGPGLRGRPVSGSMVSQRLSALTGLLTLALQLGEVDRNVARMVPRPRRSKRGPVGLTQDQFNAVLAACPDSRKGREERAILIVGVTTALRRAELCRLSGVTVQWREGGWWFRVRTKGGKEAHAQLEPEAVDAIAAMLRDRNRTLATLGEERVFGFSGAAMHYRVARAGRRVRLDLTPHTLKHSAALAAAREMARGQLTLWDIQEFLGHSSLGVTQTYLRGLVGRPSLVGKAVARGLLGRKL